MGTYRRKLDIIADILTIAAHDPKKTQIMYQANLSYNVLQKYLVELNGASLISYQDQDKCYGLTDKGRQFLDNYKCYSRIIKNIEKALNDATLKKTQLERLFSQST